MKSRLTLSIGIIMAGLGVAIGAFGAHALRPILESHGRTETFELAVRHQFYHACAILIAGLLMPSFPSRHVARAVFCFVAGIIIFSGSLYTLSLSGITALGAVTPVGGVFFITGWILLLLAVNKKGPE